MRVNVLVLLCTVCLCGCVGYRTPLEQGPDSTVPCAPGTFSLVHAQATLMFVLDRSSSMDEKIDGTLLAVSRWRALGESLATALPSVDQTMSIGALLFPADSSNDMNCSVPGKVNLLPALDNVAPLTRLLSTVKPSGYTPTGSSVEVAAKALLGIRAANQARALLLATDGAPNCNENLNRYSCRCTFIDQAQPGRACPTSVECLDDRHTEDVLAKYNRMGLPTYVVGIQTVGQDAYDDVLNAMAKAGGRPRTNSDKSYYVATSQADLDSALSTIRDQVGSCTFLTTSVPDLHGSISLFANDIEIPADRWFWSSKANGEIVLTGDACSAIANSSAAMSAVVACSGG